MHVKNIFLTGATGLIGGQVLHSLTKSGIKASITVLVRDAKKGRQLIKAYPEVEIVMGDLDDSDLIEREASHADIVLQLASTNHLRCVKAIHKGLAKRKSGHYIQISGATVLSQDEIASHTYGEPTNTIFDDCDNLSDLKHEIKCHPDREVDNYLLNLTEQTPHVKTATVFAPIIYGLGEGPVNRRSIQVPELCRIALERGRGIQVGRGLNRWGNVHIGDLGGLFVLLVEDALKGSGDGAAWGKDGLYFAGAGEEMTFGEISQRIVHVASDIGLLEDLPVESVTAKEVDKLSSGASGILGTNAREHAQLAKRVLGWAPDRHSLQDDIHRSIEFEARRKMSSR